MRAHPRARAGVSGSPGRLLWGVGRGRVGPAARDRRPRLTRPGPAGTGPGRTQAERADDPLRGRHGHGGLHRRPGGAWRPAWALGPATFDADAGQYILVCVPSTSVCQKEMESGEGRRRHSEREICCRLAHAHAHAHTHTCGLRHGDDSQMRHSDHDGDSIQRVSA